MKILYIQPIHESGMERLAKRHEVLVAPDTRRETLLRLIADADAVVTRLTPVDREMIERGKRLKAICKHGVGVDNIDTAFAASRGIAIVTTGDANSSAVAEHAMFAIGALHKRMVPLDRAVRAGAWGLRDCSGAEDVRGKVLGIVGLGRIGGCLARMAGAGFGMEVWAYGPRLDEATAAMHGCRAAPDLEDLLRRTDVISLHVPLTDETRHLIDARRLSLLRKGAYLVNFARGEVVDETALYEALRDGHLAGAALDAFETEPPDITRPLYQLDNVLLSPHCAALTEDARRSMSLRIAEALGMILDGAARG